MEKYLMKKFILIIALLFWAGILYSQEVTTSTMDVKLRQAQAEVNRLTVLYEAEMEKVRNLILQNDEMRKFIESQNQGILDTKKILQDGIDNGGKVEFQKLIDLQWNLVLPDKSDKDKGSGKKD